VRKTSAVLALICGTFGCGKRPPDPTDLVPATLSAQPAIPYPPDLFTRRVEGEALLYLVVDSAGLPIRDSTRIEKSSGQSAFDAAALQAAATLRFSPATRAGVPVTAPIQIPIRFTLPDSIKHPRAHP
jgi:TonB family protein